MNSTDILSNFIIHLMRKLILTILIVILGLPMMAQDIRFPTAIVSAGGSSVEGSSASLSRWRIGQIHVLTLPEATSLKERNEVLDWKITIYPNPVNDILYLEFELPEARELTLKITDVAGRIILYQEAQSYVDGSSLELNMAPYDPALYLLQIISSDLTCHKVYRIQKL